MQLIVNINNELLVDKIIKILEIFKSDGVEIEKKNDIKSFDYSDEYLEKNWKSFIMNCKSDEKYYKSEQYYEDRGNYLMEKYQ